MRRLLDNKKKKKKKRCPTSLAPFEMGLRWFMRKRRMRESRTAFERQKAWVNVYDAKAWEGRRLRRLRRAAAAVGEGGGGGGGWGGWGGRVEREGKVSRRSHNRKEMVFYKECKQEKIHAKKKQREEGG